MRIGYDAKRFFHNTTGLGNYSRDLLRILSEYYPGDTYILYNPKKGNVNRLIPDGNILTERRPSGLYGKWFPGIWRMAAMTKDIARDHCRIFHGLSGELPLGIKAYPVKTVVTVHDLIFMDFPRMYRPWDRKIYYRKFRYAVKTADRVVAVSEKTKNDILRYSDLKPEDIEVIYQGCHPVFKKEADETLWESLREQFSLPESYILYVGSINERKNALSIVKALRVTDIPLILVGSGNAYLRKIKDYVTQNAMTRRVFFLRNLTMEQIAALYRHSRVFVFPSLYEGFGIPIIEALYSKTPVITTAGGVFPEAGGPETLYLENPMDTGELREKIQYVLENEKVREKMITAGYQYVQRFNDETIAGNWHQLYDEIK